MQQAPDPKAAGPSVTDKGALQRNTLDTRGADRQSTGLTKGHRSHWTPI